MKTRCDRDGRPFFHYYSQDGECRKWLERELKKEPVDAKKSRQWTKGEDCQYGNNRIFPIDPIIIRRGLVKDRRSHASAKHMPTILAHKNY